MKYFTVRYNIPLPQRYRCFRSRGRRYVNMANAFDIETSSFMDGTEYRATMYIWQASIDGVIVIGRTWEEFLDFVEILTDHFNLYHDKILVIYVHNLSYEFQWIRKLFKWEEVFSIDERKPIYARTDRGIEFRCSYLLSGMNLERLGEHLLRHNIKKLVGSLDYDKIRHSGTALTSEELSYCINDVRVLTAYIAERMEIDGNITKIPHTKTGYVRRATRTACFGTDHRQRKFKKYRDFIKRLKMDPEEYVLAKDAFMGGFTHANAFHVDRTLRDVRSFDFTSSYPYVMVAFKYPMTRGRRIETDFDGFLKNKDSYAWILKIAFKNIRSRILYEHYLSKSRCNLEGSYEIDNGRVVYADFLLTSITNVDFDIIDSCYDYDDAFIVEAYQYKLEYLPTPIIESLLHFYRDKTILKGIEGKEADYMTAKENANSNYGMMVTDPLRDIITYLGHEWGVYHVDIEDGIAAYNKSRQRFLFYPWGVFVTAYARRNLWTGIHELGSDYVYSDTDSVKGINFDRHMDYIAEYNNRTVPKLLAAAMEYHGLDFELCRPKDMNGKEHMLGLWDDEGMYSRFRTLGAKRYMTEKDGNISLTISGLNKKKAVPYLLDQYGSEGIFEAFTYDKITREGFTVPPGSAGRIIARYIDCETSGTVTDYMGNERRYAEQSSIHMESGGYSLSIGRTYAQYLLGIKEMEE